MKLEDCAECNTDGNGILLSILLTGLAFLAISIFLPSTLWSLAGVDATPFGFRIVAGLMLVVAATPAAGRLCERTTQLIQSFSKARKILWFIGAVAALLLMFFFSSENHVLGDGYQILGRTVAGTGGSPFATPDFYFHHLISAAISGLFEASALWSYRLVAFTAGIGCWIGIWYFARKWQGTVLTMLLFASFSIVQFYFGYVEHYTIAFSFLIFYMLSAFSDYENDTLSIKTPVLLLMACAFHLLSIVYLPSLVFLASSRIRTQWFKLTVVLGSLALMVGVAIYVTSTTSVAKIFVPLSAVGGNPYSMLSGQHFKDLTSVLILNLPLLPILLLQRSMWTGRQRNLILVSIAFPLLFTIIFDPKLGAMRDWDILCLAMPAAFVSVAALLCKVEPAWKCRLIPLLFIFALAHTGTWIYHNASRQESYESVKREIQRDVHYSRDYLKGERLLSWAFIAGDNYRDTEEMFRAQELRLEANPDDSLTRINLANNYAIIGDTARAAKLVVGHWQGATSRQETIASIGAILESVGRYDELEAFYEKALVTTAPSFQLYRKLALLKDKRGVVDTACLYYNYALGVNPSAPLRDKIEIARYWQKNGYDYEAGALLDDLRSLLPADALPLIDKIKSAMANRRITEADSLLVLLQNHTAAK